MGKIPIGTTKCTHQQQNLFRKGAVNRNCFFRWTIQPLQAFSHVHEALLMSWLFQYCFCDHVCVWMVFEPFSDTMLVIWKGVECGLVDFFLFDKSFWTVLIIQYIIYLLLGHASSLQTLTFVTLSASLEFHGKKISGIFRFFFFLHQYRPDTTPLVEWILKNISVYQKRHEKLNSSTDNFQMLPFPVQNLQIDFFWSWFLVSNFI